MEARFVGEVLGKEPCQETACHLRGANETRRLHELPLMNSIQIWSAVPCYRFHASRLVATIVSESCGARAPRTKAATSCGTSRALPDGRANAPLCYAGVYSAGAFRRR